MRPLSWLLVCVSLAGLLIGARVVLARRGRAVATTEAPGSGARVPAPPPRVRPPAFRTSPTVPGARPTSALAHLRGRVIVPAGAVIADDDLAVTASDGEREYEAAVSQEGRFELHLPARVYTLTATLGTLVGSVERRLRPGVDESIEIPLQAGEVIEVDTRELDDPAQALITVAGRGNEIARVQIEDGKARLGGLLRGVLYDLTVSGGKRSTVLHNVTAPNHLRVELPPGITLHGAIGFPAGTTCPFHRLLIEGSNFGADQARVDRHCRFAIADLAPDSEVQLRVSEGGWHLEERVRIPATGEPAPVCLNPPCRDLPPVAPAALQVILGGAPEEGEIFVQSAQDLEHRVCAGTGDRCELAGLESEASADVTVRSESCAPVTQSLFLRAGRNTLTLGCRRLRLVEGLVRGRDRVQAVISCQDGEKVHLTEGSSFRLRCPSDVSQIIYGAGSQVRSFPLPPGVAPAVIELTL